MEWTKVTGADAYYIKAPSLAALADFAADDSEEATAQRRAFGDRSSRTETPRAEWDLGAGFAKAAAYGRSEETWTQGADLLKTATKKARAACRDMALEVAPVASPTGGRVLVQRLLNGDPRCFSAHKTGAARNRPSLAVYLATNTPGSVDANALQNLTAASVAVAAILERRGYRVRAFSGSLNTAIKPYTVQVTPLFDPSRPFNASRCAFQACHAAAPRRLGFGTLERGGKALSRLSEGYGGVARTEDAAEPIKKALQLATGSKRVLVLPAALDADTSASLAAYHQCEDLTSAVTYVLSQARAQGLDV